MAETIRVNLAHPLPLFPLGGVVLLPHALLPLHVFEPRYRQMIAYALDHVGQIAIATADDVGEGVELRPVACVGQIVQHVAMGDGRYNILLHGVVRSAIEEVLEPEGDRLYHLVRLQPHPEDRPEPDVLTAARNALLAAMRSPRMSSIHPIPALRERLDENDDVPTQAIVDLVGGAIFPEADRRYTLLEESNLVRRARLVTCELVAIDRLVARAEALNDRDWPSGMSWN